jgi:Rrf2 family cysteine metabolism transcriptional repressor
VLAARMELFMKLSTKGRYGLRAILDLAIHSQEHHVSLYNIAERQKISINYLEQIFTLLKNNGLVKSIKGAQGGYFLADKPSNIKVGTVLRNLEGSLHIVDEDEKQDIDNIALNNSIKRNVWDKLNYSIDSIVDSISLQDLMDDCSDNTQHMYYI